MAGDHDDDPTQRKRRPRTPPLGLPLIVERQSRQMLAVTSDDDLDSQDEVPVPTLDPFERRVIALEKRARSQRRQFIGALVAALGSVGAVLVWALNAREQAGADKATLRYLNERVERLESYVFRSSLPWRRDERPDPPAPKGPPQ